MKKINKVNNKYFENRFSSYYITVDHDMCKDSVKIVFDKIDKSIYVPKVPCSKVTNCLAYWQPR